METPPMQWKSLFPYTTCSKRHGLMLIPVAVDKIVRWLVLPTWYCKFFTTIVNTIMATKAALCPVLQERNITIIIAGGIVRIAEAVK